MGDPHLLWFILAHMDKPFRVAFTLLFLIASLGNVTGFGARSKTRSLNSMKAQGRSPVTAAATRSGLADGRIQPQEQPAVALPGDTEKEAFPCQSLHVTVIGVVCDGTRLDFPEVRLGDVLAEDRPLPRASRFISISERTIGGAVCRNLVIVLRWEPATPEFLQVHLDDYLTYWGDRIPYRLFWDAQYDICTVRCSTFSEAGEYLPADIDALSPSLAADVNFNGAPAAFWNMNLSP